jgi:hypothetical protein
MVVGGHYLMLKRHRCFVNWLLERRKFKSVSMTMSEVAATGMELLYPGVCSEGSSILMHTFPGNTYKYRRGQTLYSSHTGLFLRPKKQTS